MEKSMPIRVTPYTHQTEAYNFACRLFGLDGGGDEDDDHMRELQQKNPTETKSNKEI